MSWYYKPTQAIQTDDGIKAKSKRGDFVKNWWATRWIGAMERVMDSGRLRRGRTYARKGQVLSLEEGKGQITAKVQGSRPTPYKVEIALTPLDDKAWARVIEALQERPYFVAQLLAGEMPQEIEEAFKAVKLDLFPSRKELKQSCNCPDWADVCKHLAAVHYILAERFDEDPFLLFRLRGRSQDEILGGLNTAVSDTNSVVAPTYQPAPPLTDQLDTYWQMGPALAQFTLHINAPEEVYPLLERLGTPDFLPKAERTLSRVYDGVTNTAVDIAYQATHQDESNSKTETENNQ